MTSKNDRLERAPAANLIAGDLEHPEVLIEDPPSRYIAQENLLNYLKELEGLPDFPQVRAAMEECLSNLKFIEQRDASSS